jgi:hypothetical protein
LMPMFYECLEGLPAQPVALTFADQNLRGRWRGHYCQP